jgi:hypothetical protein
MLVVTEIAWDGSIRRLAVDTAGRADAARWDEMIAAVPPQPPPYRAMPGSAVYYVSIGGHVQLVAENDLAGPLRDLVAGVMTVGSPVR